jgi:hypothetical protein
MTRRGARGKRASHDRNAGGLGLTELVVGALTGWPYALALTGSRARGAAWDRLDPKLASVAPGPDRARAPSRSPSERLCPTDRVDPDFVGVHEAGSALS